MLLIPFLGQDFFPDTDSGQFTLHVRAPTGTRIEEVANLFDQVENQIRKTIPTDEMSGILDNTWHAVFVHEHAAPDEWHHKRRRRRYLRHTEGRSPSDS